MLKRGLIAIALSLIVWGFGCSKQFGTETQEVNPDAPVIIDYHAAEVIRPGTTWRVYLHAKDKNGDMRDISCVLVKRGGGLSNSVTRLSEEHREEVAGFLFLRTPVDNNLRRDSFTLRVLVRDEQGNRSERLELPLRFGRGTEQETPEKWQEKGDVRLGAIQIQIRSWFDRRR
ncbi:MAG: hypothetical protein GWN86_24025 [Desulfobacterales bacterium]|nr:hypothetical protein [Desulfobacterales bacterium]